MGWLASATILDKALEAWHHDASTGFCFDCCLLRLLNVAKVAKTAKISDRPVYLVLVPAILILPVKYIFEAQNCAPRHGGDKAAVGSRQCPNVDMWHLRVVSLVPTISEGCIRLYTISRMFCVPLTYIYIYIIIYIFFIIYVCVHACRQTYIDRLCSTIVLPVCSDLELLSSRGLAMYPCAQY